MAIALAGMSRFVTPASADIPLYTTGFETSGTNYVVGSSINPGSGWVNGGGTGTAVIANSNGLAESGQNYVLVTPPSDSSAQSFAERDTPLSGANLTIGLLDFSAGIRLLPPTSGTANRTSITGIEAFDAARHPIADCELIWDPENEVGHGANKLYLFYHWSSSTAASLDQGFGWDFGTFRSSQLNLNFGGTNNYLDVGMQLNFNSGDISFEDSLVGDETKHGTIAVGSQANAFTDFHDADLAWSGGAPGLTSPRTLVDNFWTYILVDPEPSSLALLSLAAGMLVRRRR